MNSIELGFSDKQAVQIADLIKKQRRRYGYHIIKRLFDIIASAVALVVLSPLFLVLSLIIWIDDPHGSPIFSQIRVGKNGKEFKFYKFRSMIVNAEALIDELQDKNEMQGD